ncbi:MAG: hypothetical protein A3J48_02050 [Candidatus Doudnabacteria bacterium RIFCSPHIGHO2_02_FULL_46_11]|uniref:Uncharacterized protein n=1 Tax=Candidatus Doudnabacteria bacterium RIFCSPHIGHO2_02_FULL_46_11 TaxID=1817832 RepID=A0A1F5P4H3_9BACT|nr:MAG: hypothetical protein A3J48_02050 [Candidatus Doudnabacteria bacterium RIFCSPHIGHO2_02_FULL_46_11]
MKFPPKPKTPYIFKTPQDKQILKKLNNLAEKTSKKDEPLVKFLYTQLEDDWRTPLEQYIDKLLK